jgi:serine/threonine protein kinase
MMNYFTIGQVLENRYKIQQQLGKNAGRRTLLACDLETEHLVVVKLLLFSNDFEWIDLKLFEREAETLKSLSHPAIPRYLNSFELNLSHTKGFALVQTYIEAQSIEGHLKSGRNFSEIEVKQLAKAILEILLYLHDRQPPVIHRDLKPSNILLGDRSGNSVGQVYLVDFGSVQTIAAQNGSTHTVVGTYGYMPPEQFGDRAVPASDLYSLGATLIYLVTGTHPADLPQRDGKIQLNRLANIEPAFSYWLSRAIEPSLDRRFTTAAEALQALERSQTEVKLSIKQPVGSKILLKKQTNSIEIFIPPQGFQPALIFIAFFAIAWNSFIFTWTGFALLAPFPINLAFSLFSLPFWAAGIFLAMAVLFPLFGSIRLRITQDLIALTWELFGLKYNRPRPTSRRNIDRLTYIPKHTKRDSDGDRIQVPAQLVIRAGVQQFQLGGTGGGIDREVELEWIADELSQWLGLPITRQ